MQEEEVFTKGVKESISKLLDDLSDEEKIKFFSDLAIEEIEKLALLSAINTRVKSEVINTYITEFLKLRVSKDRLGRKEGVKIGTSFAKVLAEKTRSWLPWRRKD